MLLLVECMPRTPISYVVGTVACLQQGNSIQGTQQLVVKAQNAYDTEKAVSKNPPG